MTEGWISLHRKILSWEWYDDANTFRLFIHCLLEANYEDKKWHGTLIERGSFITTCPRLAKALKLTVRQIRTSLNKLKMSGELSYSATAQYSIISIKNYDMYQNNVTQVDRLMSCWCHADDRLATTTNNIYNINNNKNNISNINKEIYKENDILFFEEKNSKKTDPFLNNLNSFFKSEYKKIFNNTPNLSFAECNKLIELGADVENFRDTIPPVLNKLKNINFNFKNGSKWNANHHWLLRDDNYLNVLDGTYDDKNSTEYEQALARCEARAKEQERE